jgi:hypothetical protein
MTARKVVEIDQFGAREVLDVAMSAVVTDADQACGTCIHHEHRMCRILGTRKHADDTCPLWERRQRKYRNRTTELDGIRFASRAEANRYAELVNLRKA